MAATTLPRHYSHDELVDALDRLGDIDMVRLMRSHDVDPDAITDLARLWASDAADTAAVAPAVGAERITAGMITFFLLALSIDNERQVCRP